jgi:hypothetical protein
MCAFVVRQAKAAAILPLSPPEFKAQHVFCLGIFPGWRDLAALER